MSACSDQSSGRGKLNKVPGLDGFLDGVAHLCIIFAGILLVFLVAIFGWLVFGRYVLNDTPTWVEQVSLVIAVYVTCFGAAAGVRNNTHLSIDFVREGLPVLPREIMRYLADIFVLVFGAFMAWQGWIMVMENIDRPIPIIGLSESWRAAPLFVCGILIVIFSGVSIAERVVFPMSDKE